MFLGLYQIENFKYFLHFVYRSFNNLSLHISNVNHKHGELILDNDTFRNKDENIHKCGAKLVRQMDKVYVQQYCLVITIAKFNQL